jgi:hypothetical protein
MLRDSYFCYTVLYYNLLPTYHLLSCSLKEAEDTGGPEEIKYEVPRMKLFATCFGFKLTDSEMQMGGSVTRPSS